jgi:hypothetical protein
MLSKKSKIFPPDFEYLSEEIASLMVISLLRLCISTPTGCFIPSSLGIPPLVARVAVRFMVIMALLVLSMIAFVSLCPGTVSLSWIPLCRSSSAKRLFLNSPPQSAWTWYTLRVTCCAFCGRFQALSNALMISIRASEVSDFFFRGFVTTYPLKSSMVTKRYLNWLSGVIDLIGPTRSTWSLSRGLVVRIFGAVF